MNGNKVLNRLIQGFIVINLILLVFNIAKCIKSYVLTRERVRDITSILRESGITLDKPLPIFYSPKIKGTIIIPESTTETKEALVKKLISHDMQQIIISSETEAEHHKPSRIYKKDTISIRFSENTITYSNDSLKSGKAADSRTAKQACFDFIKKSGFNEIFKNPYIEDASSKESTVLIYYPKLDGIPVFESFIQFDVTAGGIAKAVMHVAKIEPLKRISATHIIYPIDIVLFGIRDYLEVNKCTHITDIILGYQSLREEGMDILEREIVPVYKIEIAGLNEPLFVNAYTNERID